MSEFECNVEDTLGVQLAEHEVLLSFRNDIGAEAFHEWWFAYGKDAFENWAEDNFNGGG